MGSLVSIAPWLAIVLWSINHQMVVCVTEPPPTCNVKQVNYGMYFPVPFCRDCGHNSCFVTNLSKDAESQVAEVFTGLFHTPQHIQEVENVNLRKIHRRKRGSSDHDGDSHCPTKLTCGNVTRLVNIYGVERELVHLPSIGQYQWVLFGECANVDENCAGGCVDELTVRFLLVWNLDHPDCPMSFEPFDIKTYCSCKNLSVAPGLDPLSN